MTGIPYHSALQQGRLEDASPLEGHFHDGRGNSVFVWDVNDPLPVLPDLPDLIYAEPSWPARAESLR